jgi:MoaA/NifB/PqqE/SkfB family radical SAM enzyme
MVGKHTITDRIDNITNISEEYRKSFLPAPKSVKIELTGRCNYACSFCARSDMLRIQKDMDRDLFERLLLEMREAGVEEIGLFYLGESFLLKWLPEAIHFAKHVAKFPYVFLTTNGSLSTPKKMEACFRAGLDSLKFSLNYADVDQFVDIARVKPKLFEKMMTNIKAAKDVRDKVFEDTGHSCGLYASYIKYDDDQMRKMEELVYALTPFLDEIYPLPLYNQSGLVTDEEKRRGWGITAGNRGRLGCMVDPIPCWALFTEGHITWNGELNGCCFGHTDALEMGDLKTTPFMEAWNSDKFKELRQAHLDKNIKGTACEFCIAYA